MSAGRRHQPRAALCQTAAVRRLLPIGLVAAAIVGGGLVVVGCGSSGSKRTDANYCAAVSRHLTELNAPSIATPDDVANAVALYSSMAKVAPLAVEKEWDVLSLAYQTAATVVPDDQGSVQKAVDTIRASQPSANAAADYTKRLCNVQIGTPTVPVTASTGASGSTTTTG